jgi:hypothetical protein
MTEKLTLIVEGFVLFGLFCMFLADNKGLWLRPKSQGLSDHSRREVYTGK